MLIVCVEPARVEAELESGSLSCPSCRGVLGPCGYARQRVLRCRSGDRWLRPRRGRCRACAGTHVLLAEVALLRRQDEVSVIGAAIEANVAGEGYRRIGARLGVVADTVRGWLRRFASRADQIRAHFTRSAVVLDPELGAVLPAGSGVAESPPGRGCCGSGRPSRGRSRHGSRAGCCWQHEPPPIRGRCELRESRAR